MLKTAEQHIADLKAHARKATKEQTDFRKAQAKQEFYEDLRDDVISIVLNSGLSFEDIHAAFGPHPATLAAWLDKRITQPRMGKLRATLRACGYDFAIKRAPRA